MHKIDSGMKTARPIAGYGLTEVCGIITQVAGDFFVDKPESVGRVMPVYEARCVNDDGATVGADEIGELCVKGAPVIKGYLNRPEATAEAIVDGWFHTRYLARQGRFSRSIPEMVGYEATQLKYGEVPRP